MVGLRKAAHFECGAALMVNEMQVFFPYAYLDIGEKPSELGTVVLYDVKSGEKSMALRPAVLSDITLRTIQFVMRLPSDLGRSSRSTTGCLRGW